MSEYVETSSLVCKGLGVDGCELTHIERQAIKDKTEKLVGHILNLEARGKGNDLKFQDEGVKRTEDRNANPNVCTRKQEWEMTSTAVRWAISMSIEQIRSLYEARHRCSLW